MALDSGPVWMQNFEARIINDFLERLRIFVYPQNFDTKVQFAMDLQEEERKNMAHWREVISSALQNLSRLPAEPLYQSSSDIIPYVVILFHRIENPQIADLALSNRQTAYPTGRPLEETWRPLLPCHCPSLTTTTYPH